MEFGKLQDITKVKWDLPAEDPLTHAFLQSLQRPEAKTDFLLGAPAWAHRQWVGRIYPDSAKPADYLAHYSRQFRCIEFNSAHYSIPSPEQMQKWVAQVPENFVFIPKINQAISHRPRGLLDAKALKEWCDSLANYGAHLGPCFLQLPPHFDFSMKAELYHFLQHWPEQFELALEFRHPSWFEAGAVRPALVKYLQGRRIGLVITDTAGRRDVIHTSVTAPFTILRLVGNQLDPSDFHRCHEWCERLANWQREGLERCYFMVHQPDDTKTPEMTEHVIHDLNEVCHAELPNIQWTSRADQLLFEV